MRNVCVTFQYNGGKMEKTFINVLMYTILAYVWVANFNDLLRGSWFYNGYISIIFWNIIALLALIKIILNVLYKYNIARSQMLIEKAKKEGIL
jgi:hypothetical protein